MVIGTGRPITEVAYGLGIHVRPWREWAWRLLAFPEGHRAPWQAARSRRCVGARLRPRRCGRSGGGECPGRPGAGAKVGGVFAVELAGPGPAGCWQPAVDRGAIWRTWLSDWREPVVVIASFESVPAHRKRSLRALPQAAGVPGLGSAQRGARSIGGPL